MNNAAHLTPEDVEALILQARQLEKSDLQAAAAVGQSAYDAARLSGYVRGEAGALLVQASIAAHQGHYRPSLEQASAGLELAEAHAFTPLICDACHLLGWNYFDLGDYPASLRWGLKHLHLAEISDDLLGQADAHNLLGTVYSEQLAQHSADAIHHYRQSAALYSRLAMPDCVAVVLNNLCLTYEAIDEDADALRCAEDALALSRQDDDTYAEMMALGNLGILAVKRAAYEPAHAYYTRRLTLTRQLGFTLFEAHTLLSFGRLHRYQGQMGAALRSDHAALLLATALDHRRLIADTHEELAHCYEALGSYDAALTHLRLHNALHKALADEAIRSQLERLKIAADVDRMQDELAREREQRRIDQLYFERMSAFKDRALNMASHDLKSPLSSMLMALDVLDRHASATDERGRWALRRLRESTGEMRELIHRLLDKAMIESGRTVQLSTVWVDSLIETARRDMQSLAADKQMRVQLPAARVAVQADPFLLRQALKNLLSNAIKYSPPQGQIVIAVEVSDSTLLLRVRDNGMGIPADALPRLFEPFYRVEGSSGIEGTGLGLSIVQAIVEQHRGTVHVESSVGSGTTVTMMLPDAVVSADQAASAGAG